MRPQDLHVAQFITQYPYSDQFDGDSEYFCTGGERVAMNLAEELVDQDCQVSVVTSAASATYERCRQNGVTVHRSPSVARINTAQIAPTLPIDRLAHDFDIVHGHDTTPPGILSGWLYARLHDVPFVITHHGGENYEPHGSLVRRVGLKLYTRVLMESVFGSADTVVTPSAGYAAESRVLSTLETTVRTIPNGVDPATYALDCTPEEAKRAIGLNPENFVVLYMGALHQRKGVDVLVEGFQRFRSVIAGEAELVLAGSGELAPILEKRAEEGGMTDVVHLPGFVPEEDKPLYMTAADVFVLPSVTPAAEVFPLVLLEAAAAETPVVVSDFPTLRWIIAENEFGQLIEPGDPTAIAAALGDLYRSTDRLTALRSNARQTATEHRWTEIADQYLDLYSQLVP